MRPQLLMSVMAIFMIGTILAVFSSGRWLLNGETDIINALASFNTMSVQAGGVWTAPKTLVTYYNAIATALTWNYPYLESAWCIFLKIPLWAISVGVVFGFIQVFATVVQGLVGMVRNFLPA